MKLKGSQRGGGKRRAAAARGGEVNAPGDAFAVQVKRGESRKRREGKCVTGLPMHPGIAALRGRGGRKAPF